MSQIEDVILRIKEAGIRISLSGDQIRLDVPENSDAESIISEVKRHKPALVSYIRHALTVEDHLPARPMPMERREVYELCHQQKKEFIRFLIRGPFAFNVAFSLTFTDLDDPALEWALSAVIARHESLRTSFIEKNGKFLQRVHDASSIQLHLRRVDLRDCADREEEAMRLLYDAVKRPFDFHEPLLPDILLVHYVEGEYYLLLTVPHAACDALSGEVLKKEIYALYHSRMTGEPAGLASMPIQYRDYAFWLNAYLRGPAGVAARMFYRRTLMESIDLERDAKRRFQGEVYHPELPSYRAILKEELMRALGSGNEDSYPDAYGTIVNLYPEAGAYYRTFLHGKVFDRIKSRSSDKNTSLFNILLAAFAIMLGNDGPSRHVRIYTPFSTRGFEEFEPIVGWLTSEIIVCIPLDPDQTVDEFLNVVNDLVLEASAHRWYPYEQVLADLDISLPVLAPALINYIEASSTAAGDLSSFHKSEGMGHFELHSRVTAYSNGIEIATDYDRRKYSPDRLEKMMKDFASILEYISISQEETLSSILTCD